MKWTRTSVALVPLALGLFGYAVFAVISGTDGTLWQRGASLGMTGISLILGLSLLNYALRFARWQYYLQTLGYQVPWPAGFVYYVAGFAFTTTPGKMGEAVRAVYLKRRGVPYSQSLSTLFVERLSDLIAMVVLSMLALWEFPQYASMIAMAAGVIVLLFVVLARSDVAWGRLGRRLPARVQARLSHRLHDLRILAASAARLMRGKALIAGILLALVSWGAEGLSLYYILHFLGTPLGLTTAVSIYAVSVLVGALSFLPGGLGSTEAAMAVLLVLAGVDHTSALAATLVCRLATLWFAVALGALAMFASGTRRAAIETDAG